MTAPSKVATIALPLKTQPGDSGTTTLIMDGNGVPIGGTTGDHHPQHAELLVRTFNAAWPTSSTGAVH